MKKAFLILAVLIGSAAAALAQPKAIGGRLGFNCADFSYQNYVLGNDFLEIDLGIDNGSDMGNFHADGIYNFMILRPDWTTSGSWGFYAGPGASIAVWNKDDETTVHAGFLGNVGLEYNFDFPLQLSVDLRPRLMFSGNDHSPVSLGVGVRYAF